MVESKNQSEDVCWNDAKIRWPEDTTEEPIIESEQEAPFDPFADSNPQQVFSFSFATQDETISLDIHGFKTDSDEVWQSTGLTLWKASKYLCDYMVHHSDAFRGKTVLELGAGLGLNGILAHRLHASKVVITDGDSDAMIELRKNIAVNKKNHDEEAVNAAQLIWGLESAREFLENSHVASSLSFPKPTFSIILASDVIYAAIVIDPLWQTVRTLLRDPDGEFWMAFAVRKVPVTIDFVLQKANEYGFQYELVDSQDESDTTEDVEGNPETGPVYIYVFRWDKTKT